MQASAWSVKTHQGFGSIGSSLSTGFQIYLSNYQDRYVSPGCTTRCAFFWSLSSLFQHVDLVTTSLRAWFQVYLSQPWVLCTQAKTVQKDLLGVESCFWVLFLVNCLGGWNPEMWLVPCRRQGMLTKGPAPDRKCKFVTLPHLLDCLNCVPGILCPLYYYYYK